MCLDVESEPMQHVMRDARYDRSHTLTNNQNRTHTFQIVADNEIYMSILQRKFETDA